MLNLLVKIMYSNNASSAANCSGCKDTSVMSITIPCSVTITCMRRVSLCYKSRGLPTYDKCVSASCGLCAKVRMGEALKPAKMINTVKYFYVDCNQLIANI